MSQDFKLLQRGEDPIFDQLLTGLSSVAEHCLPSILRTLFSWYDRQGVNWLGSPMASGSVSSGTSSSLTSGVESLEKEHISMDPLVLEKRDMAVEFIFCLVLIEVLKQLPFHPGHHDLVGKIEDLAFIHFKYREGYAFFSVFSAGWHPLLFSLCNNSLKLTLLNGHIWF